MPFIKRFSFAKITNSLRPSSTNNVIGNPFVELERVDSTNNYAMAMVKKGFAKHGTAYFAYEQTTGKGQRGKRWQSAVGENIILSVVANTSMFKLSQQFSISMIAALSAQNLFNKYTTNNTKIKWTNDVYWQDRKAGGILIENVIEGNKWRYAVIGIGLNINQTKFNSELKNAVSLKQITSKSFDLKMLSLQLCENLEKWFVEFKNGKHEAILNEYNNLLYKQGQEACFEKDQEKFVAEIIGVQQDGRLLLEHNAKINAYRFGEIEWLINS